MAEDVRFWSSQIHALNSDVPTQQPQETSPQSHSISPSFYLEDTSANINFHSSPCCHGHVSVPALPSHIPAPFFPQPSALAARHSQPLSGHSWQRGWNMELLPHKFSFSSPSLSPSACSAFPQLCSLPGEAPAWSCAGEPRARFQSLFQGSFAQ